MTTDPMTGSTSGLPRVLYIGGTGRSGSTLLERLLGEVPGLCPAGEVVHLWRRGLVEGQRCGCGAVFSECPFWTKVGHEAFGSWDGLDPERMVALQHAVDRTRYIPALVTPAISARHRRDRARFAADLERLYAAIGQVAGAEVVIDSSKHASSAFLLRTIAGLDLRVVHLVRDSHGVAFSWTKRVRRPEIVSGKGFMPRYRPGTVGRQWVTTNSLFHGLERLGVPTLFVRYEALVSEPAGEIRRILDFAGVAAGPEELAFLHDHHAELEPGHSVSGNPMRFRHGRVPLALDEAWRKQMRPLHRRTVSAITWPLLLHYGYRNSRRTS
jgi:hypothetical protein